MAKTSTEAISAGPSCSIWLAPVDTPYPAGMDDAFADTAGWIDIGYLKLPPSFSRTQSRTPLEVWNSLEPLANILDSEENTVTLTPVQTNRSTLELYFGELDYTTITGGVHITPQTDAGDVTRAFCLEIIDSIFGGNVLRIGWPRAQVSEPGNLNMEKADVLNYELTMKRLQPDTGPTFFLDSNVATLVSG